MTTFLVSDIRVERLKYIVYNGLFITSGMRQYVSMENLCKALKKIKEGFDDEFEIPYHELWEPDEKYHPHNIKIFKGFLEFRYYKSKKYYSEDDHELCMMYHIPGHGMGGSSGAGEKFYIKGINFIASRIQNAWENYRIKKIQICASIKIQKAWRTYVHDKYKPGGIGYIYAKNSFMNNIFSQ